MQSWGLNCWTAVGRSRVRAWHLPNFHNLLMRVATMSLCLLDCPLLSCYVYSYNFCQPGLPPNHSRRKLEFCPLVSPAFPYFGVLELVLITRGIPFAWNSLHDPVISKKLFDNVVWRRHQVLTVFNNLICQDMGQGPYDVVAVTDKPERAHALFSSVHWPVRVRLLQPPPGQRPWKYRWFDTERYLLNLAFDFICRFFMIPHSVWQFFIVPLPLPHFFTAGTGTAHEVICDTAQGVWFRSPFGDLCWCFRHCIYGLSTRLAQGTCCKICCAHVLHRCQATGISSWYGLCVL